MSRQDRRPDEPGLFDLPLDQPTAPAAPRRSPRAERAERGERGSRSERAPAGEALPLFAPTASARGAETERNAAPEAVRGAQRDERRLHAVPFAGGAPGVARAGIGRRLLAGLGDLALHAAVFVLMLAGARLLGSEVTPAALLPTALGLLLFSLLYTVLPLAFWGQTPGMSFAGIVSSSVDGEPLSFGQSFRLWLASLVAVLLAGLPTVIAPRGRSLSDRLAGARTVPSAR